MIMYICDTLLLCVYSICLFVEQSLNYVTYTFHVLPVLALGALILCSMASGANAKYTVDKYGCNDTLGICDTVISTVSKSWANYGLTCLPDCIGSLTALQVL